MIDPSTPPSRLLKIMAGLGRWSLGLLLAFSLLLTIAWGGLHGFIVPRIGDFRPQLETHAAQALGIPVRIGAISAHTDSVLPSIELLHVELLDAAGRTALLLPRVVVALSPRSLLKLGFEQLYIEKPDLNIRRAPDGRISVAGLTINPDAPSDNSAADWLFSQSEVFIQGGTVRWTDEQRGAPELAMHQVDVVLRNGHWDHRLRMDATPPPDWGDRFSLVGLFRSPLLSTRSSDWNHWSGQFFAQFARLNVAKLRQHADVGVEINQGHGGLRVWCDVQRGQVMGGVADIALADVNTRLQPDLKALALPSLAGRLGARRITGGYEFFTQALHFLTDDGLTWPGGNLRLTHLPATSKIPASGEFRADHLDLAALAEIASRLPVGTEAHQALDNYAPKGLVNDIYATWKGPFDGSQQYRVRGNIQGLALGADASAAAPPTHFGVRGATVDLDLSQAGGKANVNLESGALLLPGVFEDPVLLLDKLRAEVRWQLQGEHIAVQANDVHFSNADAQGEARASWRTSDANKVGHRSAFPGVLDLTGILNRADGTRVHRYLPLSIPHDARHYVRDAVVAGTASGVQFRVKGDLHQLPFSEPKQGEFHIAAQVKDVTYAYVPPSLQPTNALHWPALTQLSGELVFDRASMLVRDARGSFAGHKELRLTKVEAKIPDLEHTVVSVNAEAKGPLPELLTLMSTSPLGSMTGNALEHAQASGNAGVQFRLDLPVSELEKTKVQGSVTLTGNELRITPDTPGFSQARGAVQFSDTGFTLNGVQAQALGGPVRLEGGMKALPPQAPAAEASVQLRAQGTATAEGLQQTPQLGLLSQLAQRATGSAPYAMTLAFRRGVPEIQITTQLQGLALALPAPLGKIADASLPLRFENRVARESLVGLTHDGNTSNAPPLRDQVTLDLGTLGSATYLRDLSGSQPKVLFGSIGIGLSDGESAPLPAQGVAANVRQDKIDVAAWEAVLAGPASMQASTTASSAVNTLAAQDYLPTTLALRTKELVVQGRSLHNVVAGARRDGNIWHANLDATELSGFMEYRSPGSPDHPNGRVFARLSRATVPQSEVTQVESLIDEQPGTLPALDIVVDDLELQGKRLGRLEIEAQNRGGENVQREWRLTKLNVLVPEASFTAIGNWAVPAASGAGPRTAERRTALNFKLDVRDSGELLGRLGMAHVIRHGKGRMEGQVAWDGAPFSPDYRSMSGQINLNIEAGQFLKAEPGLAKLLSVLSLQSLPRRLALDFRDVFSEGFAFDFVRGDVRIEQGVAQTNNLQMKGVNAAVLMEGQANIQQETQDLRVVVVPEINAMTASLVATAINPVIGLGSFLAQVFLRGPLIEAATQEFHIDGTWADPRVVRVNRRDRSTSPAGNAPGTASPATGDKS
jgi:uncharacterized protein (TIGR02099 family)